MRTGRPSLTTQQQARLIETIEANGLAQEALYLWPKPRSAPSDASPVGAYGGLPVLPPGVDWPISPLSNEPVHFLFQIECAALPDCRHPHRPLLPDRGVLMVFGGLTFPYVEDHMGETPGLAYLVHAPDATLDDPGRPVPPGMTSPFDEVVGFAELVPGYKSPNGLELPRVPMRACAVSQLRVVTDNLVFGGDKSLAAAYEQMMSVVDGQAFLEACPDIETHPNGRWKSGLNPHVAIKMLGEVDGYQNAEGFTNDLADGVRLFSMTWPPAAGVRLGDPTVDIKIAHPALADGDWAAVRTILDAT